MAPTVVSLIVGGTGNSRLFPLTRDRCLQALPMGGKYRLVDVSISNCLNSSISRILVLTHHNAASLNHHLKNTYRFDIFHNGYVDILTAEQGHNSSSWFRGTADALRQACKYSKFHDSDYVLILTGGGLYQADFRQFLDSHLRSGADISVGLVPAEKKGRRGKVPLHPVENRDTEISSMGVFLMRREILCQWLHLYPDAYDFEKQILSNETASRAKIHYHMYEGYYVEISSLNAYYRANLDLTELSPQFDLYNFEKSIYSEKCCLPAPKIVNTHVDRSIVCEGSVIEAKKLQRSIIGRRMRIGPDTIIRNSLIMGNDQNLVAQHDPTVEGSTLPPVGIGYDCRIEYAIIDKNCRIGNHVQIRGDGRQGPLKVLKNESLKDVRVEDGMIILPKGTVIPDHMVIGI